MSSRIHFAVAADGHRRIGSRPRTVDEYFAIEQPLLMPLPQEPFETGRLFTPRVDRYSQIALRTNRYSVPTGLIGKRVRVALNASHLVVYDAPPTRTSTWPGRHSSAGSTWTTRSACSSRPSAGRSTGCENRKPPTG
jgi:hypothetical protein